MKSLNKKVLASAVLASFAGAAQAVYVDHMGLGQALVYPHYTVQNGHNTYISVVNTTTAVKVVKVRFKEGKASADVLDFNLYLSPNDVWTAAVIPSSSAAGAPARLITSDVSCTNPAIPAAGVDFRNYEYVNSSPLGGTGLDRTREGYLEMLEMGTLNPAAAPGSAAVHAASGAPTCTGLRGRPLPAVVAAMLPPSGGLMGTGTLINVTNGQDSGYSATAFASVFAAANYSEADEPVPSLGSAPDPESIVISGNRSHRSSFTAANRTDAVSSVIMQSAVLNEYILDTSTNSNTDWVLTFPTKHLYVTQAAAITPFTNKFTASGACETIGFTFFDREERSVTPAAGDFSPLPPGSPASSLCWESNVVSIRNGAAHVPTGTSSGVLGSANTTAINVTSGFQNGWATLSFTGTAATTTGIRAASGTTTNLQTGAVSSTAPTFLGLPVVGFMIRTFNNGTLGNFQANYGSAFDHKYRQSITPTP